MAEKKTIEDLDADWLPGATAFVGLSLGSLVIRWGPYDPKEAGAFMTRLVEADPDRNIPFFVGVQCDPLPDPVETILGMGWMPKEEYLAKVAEEEHVSEELAEQAVDKLVESDELRPEYALKKEITRCRTLLDQCREMRGTPGVNMEFMIANLEGATARAELANSPEDVARSLEELKGFES